MLIDGDLQGLRGIFADQPRVNDPRLGWVEEPLFEAFVLASHTGLIERQARVQTIATTITALGAVEECILSLVRRGAKVRLPVALSAVISSDGIDSLRIYHSMWPLIGGHLVRPPILARVPELIVPGVIGRYHDSLAKADVTGALHEFDPAAVVREPEGELYVHRGTAELRRFFGGLFARGGISLESCSLTDDGICCALEYNVTGWGNPLLPHQAGIAVYKRSDSGLLAAARMYQDVERPPLPN